MSTRLTQLDFENLSAYLDGELGGDLRAEVEQRIVADPAWRKAYAELASIEKSLDAYAAPAADADLAARILAGVRQAEHRAMGWRVAKWLAGAAAAAACITLGFVLFTRPDVKPTPAMASVEVNKSTAYKQVSPADRAQVETLIVENLGFFKNIDVAQDFETLKAVEQLEREGT